MEPKGLFRQAALEKLSSPERLDVMMQVTSPAAWIALAGTGAVLLVLVFWGVLGSIAIKVNGNAILVRGDEVIQITSGVKGTVAQEPPAEGTIVREGQEIAKIDVPDFEEQVRIAEEKAQRVESQNTPLIAASRSQLALLQQKAAQDRVSYQQGYITFTQSVQSQEAVTAKAQEVANLENQIENARAELRNLKSQAGVVIKSVRDGRVIYRASAGQSVNPGDAIVRLEELDVPMRALVYIRAGDGKKVKPGMATQVSPATERVEEFGSMVGSVAVVSDYPHSMEDVNKIINNPQLARELTGEGSAIKILVDLRQDLSTPSGYAWTSSKGPPHTVSSGTPCGASITVDKKRPISYVIPIIRKAVGAG